MVNQPKITQEQVRDRANDNSFQRGKSYYRNGSISDTVRRGSEIEGYCEGSQPEPYHVRIILSAHDIEEAFCTCEYSFDGDCKHIVALLLAYINEPEAFMERPAIEDSLAARDKDELISLIHAMIERYPDLQMLVDRPVPSTEGRRTPLDVSSFRKELRHAIRSHEGWGDHRVERALYSIAKTAQQFGAKGDWHSASAIYCAVVEESLSDYGIREADEDGELVEALTTILDEMAGCLDHLSNDNNERIAVFERLLDVFFADEERGGYTLDYDIAETILKYAHQTDLAFLRDRVETAKKRYAKSSQGRWGVEAYEAFLMQLDVLDDTDPEATLERLREEGMVNLVIAKLIEMNRLDEAVAEIEKEITDPFDLLRELPRLTAIGREDDAVRLAQQTLKKAYNDQLVEWLLERFYVRGDQEQYFQWQLRRMKKHPLLAYYIELKAASQALGNWDDVRWDLISWLEKERKYELLAQIYLYDEQWEEAWKNLRRVGHPEQRDWTTGRSIEFEVAEKTRHIFPERALPVYVKTTRLAIDRRSRDDYREAAEYLAIARELYKATNDTDSWSKLIADIKTEFKQLRALQDELRKARL